ncbi:MAG: hypothetical protein Q8776_02435, partial [Sweet potato little leaf phytoplasma]|nr:hypothetical protein [Sweet potato little leaf phytoplasma]
RCEHCDKTTQLQIHHIGTVRNAHHQSIMNKRTTVLCEDCHRKITNQQPHDIIKNIHNLSYSVGLMSNPFRFKHLLSQKKKIRHSLLSLWFKMIRSLVEKCEPLLNRKKQKCS